MPYIDQDSRAALVGRVPYEDVQDRVTAPMDRYHGLVIMVEEIVSEGELNFALTTLVDDYINRNGGVNYSRVNAAVGALECAKLELYRRLAAPYEDKKIEENGDVY